MIVIFQIKIICVDNNSNISVSNFHVIRFYFEKYLYYVNFSIEIFRAINSFN